MDTYSDDFYTTIAPGCRDSAAVVVPLVLDTYAKLNGGSGALGLTVVDVGCGQGWWGAEFAAHGCDVTGIDGGYVPDRQIEAFVEADLAQQLPEFARAFEVAVCLEVAEHLPPSRAAGFVADLCALSEFIVFSAAIPHQSGAGHINCQWPTYWAELFAAHGYHMDGNMRWQLWTDDRVEPWYRQNLMIVSPHVEPGLPLDVVHPVLHGWGR
jgi:SAM-dependent methyltransferase